MIAAAAGALAAAVMLLGTPGPGHTTSSSSRVIGRLRHHYAHRLDGVDLVTIETANPDGVAAAARGNAPGHLRGHRSTN